MGNGRKLMTRANAVKEAQRIANETGMYMLVLCVAEQAGGPVEEVYFPATIEELEGEQETLLAAGYGPTK